MTERGLVMRVPAKMVECPYCGVPVSEKRLEKHKTVNCPKEPGRILSRRPKVPKRRGTPPPGSIVMNPERAAYLRYMNAQRDSMSD
jgi:hypothetical protein